MLKPEGIQGGIAQHISLLMPPDKLKFRVLWCIPRLVVHTIRKAGRRDFFSECADGVGVICFVHEFLMIYAALK
jgi:hypothetical protein